MHINSFTSIDTYTHRAVCPLLCWQARWGVVCLTASWSVMGVCDGASGWFSPLRKQSPLHSSTKHTLAQGTSRYEYISLFSLSILPSIHLYVCPGQPKTPQLSCLSSRRQLNPGRPRLLLKLQIIFPLPSFCRERGE